MLTSASNPQQPTRPACPAALVARTSECNSKMMLWRWTPCGAAAGHSGLMLRLRCTRLAGCKKPMIVTLEQHESSVGHVSATSILKVRDRRSMGRRGCRTVSRSAKCVESPARRQQFQSDTLGLRRREPSNLDLHSDHQSYQSKGCSYQHFWYVNRRPTSLFNNPHIETRSPAHERKAANRALAIIKQPRP